MKNIKLSNEKKLKYMEFINREEGFRHHYYNEEMLQYEYLKAGDMRAVEESSKMFSSNLIGKLSDNELKNYKYMFVAAVTLATRFAIEGGMEEELAYNISDMYIQKMDKCKDINNIKFLHKEMFEYFTNGVIAVKEKNINNRIITLCTDYIYYHLSEDIRVRNLAENVNLSPNYLSVLFKKYMGISISDYILKKKVEASENMLKYSNFSYLEISTYLNFSSQSHFIRVFKKYTNMTPKKYREMFFRTSF